LEALIGGMLIDPSLLAEDMVDPLALAEEHEVAQVILHSVNALSSAER